MAECHYPDAGGFGNNPEHTLFGTLTVEYALDAALKFAYKHPNTLILVVGNHETGGLSVLHNPQDPSNPFCQYTSNGPTALPVNLYAAGPGAKRFSGNLDNIMIPRIIADLWNLPLVNK